MARPYTNVTPANFEQSIPQSLTAKNTYKSLYEHLIPHEKKKPTPRAFTAKHNEKLEAKTTADADFAAFNTVRAGDPSLMNAISYLPVKSNAFLAANVFKFESEAEANAKLNEFIKNEAGKTRKQARMTASINRKTHAKKFIVKSGLYFDVQTKFQQAHPGYRKMLAQRSARMDQMKTYKGRYLSNNALKIAPGFQLTLVKRNEGAENHLLAGAVTMPEGIDGGKFFLALKPISSKHNAMKKWLVLFDHKHPEFDIAELTKAWLPRVSGGQRGHKMRRVYTANVEGGRGFVAFKKENYKETPSKSELVVYGHQEVADGVTEYKRRKQTALDSTSQRLDASRQEIAKSGFVQSNECGGWIIMHKISKFGLADAAYSFKPFYSRVTSQYVLVNVGVLKTNLPVHYRRVQGQPEVKEYLAHKATFVFSKRKSMLAIPEMKSVDAITITGTAAELKAQRGVGVDTGRVINLTMTTPKVAGMDNSPITYMGKIESQQVPPSSAPQDKEITAQGLNVVIDEVWLSTWYGAGAPMSASAVATFIYVLKSVAQCLMQVRVSLGSDRFRIPKEANARQTINTWFPFVFPKAGGFTAEIYAADVNTGLSFPAVYADKQGFVPQFTEYLTMVEGEQISKNQPDKLKLASRRADAETAMNHGIIELPA